MIEYIFDEFKSPAGRLDKDGYEAFLRGIGAWGSCSYTSEGWSSKWPVECKCLRSTAERGIDLTSITYLYTQYRAHNLERDFTMVHGTSAADDKTLFLIAMA